MNTQVRPSQIVLMVSGAVAFISLFLTWLETPIDDYGAFGDFVFPFGAYIGLIGLAVGVLVALTAFGNVNLPDTVLGFTWTQIYLVLSVFAGLLAIGFLLFALPSGVDRSIGLWLGFLGSAGLVAGAVMLHLEGERADAAPSAPPTPF